MHYGCINLKCLALIVLLSLSWLAPSIYAVDVLPIRSEGLSLFDSAAGGFPFGAYNTTNYPAGVNPVVSGPPPHNFTEAQKIQQIQWGVNAYYPTQTQRSAYILFPFNRSAPITLGENFAVGALQHFNREIYQLSITSFTMHIDIKLYDPINNLVTSLTFNNITITHDETLNPASDIATWTAGTLNKDFTYLGKTYTLSLLGILPSYDPNCPGQCFRTLENSQNYAPIMAVINGPPPVVPEPRTYLILCSLIGMILCFKYLSCTKEKKRLKYQLRQVNEENNK